MKSNGSIYLLTVCRIVVLICGDYKFIRDLRFWRLCELMWPLLIDVPNHKDHARNWQISHSYLFRILWTYW